MCAAAASCCAGGADVKRGAAPPHSSQRPAPGGGGAELQLPQWAARGETSRTLASLNQSSQAPNRSLRRPAGSTPLRRALHGGAPLHAGLLSPLSDGGGRLGVARASFFPEAGGSVPRRRRPLAQRRSQVISSVRSGPAASFSGAAPASACLGAERGSSGRGGAPTTSELAESKSARPGEGGDGGGSDASERGQRELLPLRRQRQLPSLLLRSLPSPGASVRTPHHVCKQGRIRWRRIDHADLLSPVAVWPSRGGFFFQ
ncbi:unnamed protein product [Urochloa humidicola]